MLKVDTIKKVTITEQVIEQIALLITSGQLKARDQLPNERDLAVMFGVTRGRIREALRALSVVGLITIKAGEGSFVNEQEMPIPAETIVWMFHNERKNFDEIFMARKLIESEVYSLGARNATVQQIEKLEQYISILSDLKSTEEFVDVLEQFDLLMAQISQNQIYAKLMQTIIYLRRESSTKLLSLPGSWEHSIKTRNQIVQAIKEGDIKKVEKAINYYYKTLKKLYATVFPTN